MAPNIVSSGDGKYLTAWTQRSTDLRWVVTAAHCLFTGNGVQVDNDEIRVFGGTLRTDAKGRAEHHVEDLEIHPDYDRNSLANDIALLRVTDPVNSIAEADLVRASIRLPDDIDALWLYKPYAALTVHGWGRTSEGGDLSTYLQKLQIPHVDRSTCTAAYGLLGATIAASMICSGFSNGGFDSCQGDSGGPLSFVPAAGVPNPSNDPILAGVVSWGYGCARQNLYGVYTNVLHMRPWLEEAAVRMHP